MFRNLQHIKNQLEDGYEIPCDLCRENVFDYIVRLKSIEDNVGCLCHHCVCVGLVEIKDKYSAMVNPYITLLVFEYVLKDGKLERLEGGLFGC